MKTLLIAGRDDRRDHLARPILAASKYRLEDPWLITTASCTPTEMASASAVERIKGNRDRALAIHAAEKIKPFPNRYPSNADAIGIELVGEAPGERGKEIFAAVTDRQNQSLGWIIRELVDAFGVSMQEIYRRPDIAHVTEAKTAKW
jgi:hypothetical protein